MADQGVLWRNIISISPPLGRICLPIAIAKVAVCLTSEDAGWITGERGLSCLTIF
jgi:hypothetical protein